MQKKMSDEVHSDAEKSASKSQASTSHNEVHLDIRDEELMLTKLRQQQEELHAKNEQRVWPNGENSAKIKRIPEIMKKNANFEEYFTPKKLKFGPIHCHPSSYHDIKLKLAAFFISASGSKREDILENFKIKMKGIGTCFDDDITSKIGDEELMRLLFLDGCAILGLIHCYGSSPLDIQTGDIEQDLLLVENQIPFRVLQVLIDSGTDQGKQRLKFSMMIFFFLVCRGTFPGHSPEDLGEYLEKYCFSEETNMNQKAVHLLDVFREALLFKPSSNDLSGCLLTVIRGTFWILCSCGCSPISYFLERFRPITELKIISLLRGVKEFFFSVQELKAAGIKFKPSHSLKTVSFRSLFFFRPQLMLPTLIVDKSTASKLVNLVAYEMCLSESRPDEEPWVTSYVNLLDSLVDNEQDIKDLRAAGILRNTLSTDESAAKLINEVGSGCIAPTGDAYDEVKEKIEKYYKTRCAVWVAQVCSTHFSSPWTIIGLFAATAVLVLTAVQTWYAVNQKK